MSFNGQGAGFLIWERRNPKVSPVQHVVDGVAYYLDKFKVNPRVVYVRAAEDVIEVSGVRVLPVPPQSLVLQKNQYAIGTEELGRDNVVG